MSAKTLTLTGHHPILSGLPYHAPSALNHKHITLHISALSLSINEHHNWFSLTQAR